MNRRHFLLLAAALPAAAAPTWALPHLPPERLRDIEAAVRAEMERQGIPGLSAAVAAEGELKWSAGFGFQDLENQVPAKPLTSYRLGSIAKPVTALAAMQLWEQGRLDLDAPVRKYVPAFPEKPWPVTTRQLLGHLGGIRHYRGNEINITRQYPTLVEGLDIFKDDPLLHQPGTKYAYTTYGYNLVGCAVESASGMQFPDYLRQHIFRPSGTRDLRVDSVAELIPNRAQGYRKGPDGKLRNSNLADTSYKIPGGGLCGTVEDLARLALAVQAGKLVRPATLELMWTRQKMLDGQETGYGLGWSVNTRNGEREIAHSGGQQRISTLLYTLPEARCAVALMSNLEGAQLTALARQIADMARR